MARKKNDIEEYRTIEEDRIWRIDRFGPMQDRFGKLFPKDLAQLHTMAQGHPTQWRMCRMMYGINPLVPKADSDVEFLKCFEVEEIAKISNVEVAVIEDQLDFLAFKWNEYTRDRPADNELAVAEAVVPAPLTPEIGPEEYEKLSKIITDHGFTMKMFDVERKDDLERTDEIRWFAKRLGEIGQALHQTNASGNARRIIINELQMRRLDNESCSTPVLSKDFERIQKTQNTIESMYQKQWEQLEESCPYLKAARNKVNVTGCFSQLVEIVRNAALGRLTKKDPLIDGFFSAFEIQVELRESEQLPVRYRPGLVAAILEAKAGLFDPAFKSKLPVSHLRAMDEGFREAQAKLRERHGIVIDLEAAGPEGEFPPLFVPDEEEDIAAPEACVSIDNNPVRAT
jgi:hypothetical protein